jgi:Tfp pilus assembly protein PilF
LRLQQKNYGDAIEGFKKAYEAQKKYPNKNNNKFMAGITAHNMGVVCVLAGHEDLAMSIFQDAIELKRAAFGEEHLEVAVSS